MPYFTIYLNYNLFVKIVFMSVAIVPVILLGLVIKG